MLRGERLFANAAASACLLLALAISVLAGLIPGILDLRGTLAILSLGAVALTVLLLRRTALGASSSPQARPTVARPGPQDIRPEPIEIQASRAVFYLGTVTMGQASFRLPLGLTISEICFLIALAGCALATLRGRSPVSLPPLLIFGTCLFAFGASLSSFAANSPVSSEAGALHGIYVFVLWTWTAAMLLSTSRHVLVAITLWCLSAAVDGTAALTQVLGFDAFAGPLEGHRATGFTEHPNDLGGVTAIALVPALLVATASPSVGVPGPRVARWLIVALIATGLILSASVGAMVAAIGAILVWLSSPVVRGSGRVAVVVGIASMLLAVAVVGGRVTSPTHRLELVTSRPGALEGSGSGEDRLSIARAVRPHIESNPLVGSGLDPEGKTVTILSNGTPITYQVHGLPLAVWYETGFFGLIGVLAILGAIAQSGWRALSTARTDTERWISWALLAAVAAFAIHSLAVPFDFQQYEWISAVMLFAWLLRRELIPFEFRTSPGETLDQGFDHLQPRPG